MKEKFKIDVTLPNGYVLSGSRLNDKERQGFNKHSIYDYTITITQEKCVVKKEDKVVFSCDVIWGQYLKITV